MKKRTIKKLLLSTFMTVSFIGCGDACLDLAHQICDCEPSSMARQSCKQKVDGVADETEPSEAEIEQCEILLDTCTCDELAAGNYAACGLAYE